MKWDRRAIACFDQALADVGLANTMRCDKCCTILRLGEHENDASLPAARR